MTRFLKKPAAFMLIFIMLLGLMTTNASGYSGIALDVEDTRVYQSTTAYKLLSAFFLNANHAQNTYDGHYMVVYAKLTGKENSNKVFYIRDNDNTYSRSIKCSSSNALGALPGIEIGATVRVYGRIDISTFWSNDIEIKADKIEPTGMTTASEKSYMTINGVWIDKISMLNRNIEGKFSYKIPAGWATVERELPNVPGYQYKLNDLTGDGIAESLFVFYVDESYLEKPTDISNMKKVRKAIVEDILCNKHLSMYQSYIPFFDRDIEITKKSTDYASFTYYTGSYTERNVNRYNHRVEFAFIENDRKDGVCAILYVYNSAVHKDEIHLMMRMLAD
ncbi:MAG: hypothetical protein IKX80_00435 [Lachnospiraceae bacterium]|nr:hypothetical protein [Lachnospiraceae bacterium]MBR5731889.1 hypothetical protein [Lachnospiraceae bacterium]